MAAGDVLPAGCLFDMLFVYVFSYFPRRKGS